MASEKTQVIVRFFCLVIILVLIIAVYFNGKDLSCNKCIVNFQATKSGYKEAYDKPMQEFNLSLQSIYDYYIKYNDCLVKWEDDEGFKVVLNVTPN